MSARWVDNIHFVHAIMDNYVCNDILRKNVKESAFKMGMPNVHMFQKDYDNKHTEEFNRQWLIWDIPKQSKTPAQYPDLNHFEKGVHKVSIKSKDHL